MLYFIQQLFVQSVVWLGLVLGLPGDLPKDVTVPTSHFILGTTSAQVVKVIDGDTIDVRVNSAIIRVRYIGIDTPEPYATGAPECGSGAATIRNQELVSSQTITLVPGIDPRDKYERLLAYVYVGDTFVNKTLIAEGYATVMMIQPNTQYQPEFTHLYKNARKEKLGMWAYCPDV